MKIDKDVLLNKLEFAGFLFVYIFLFFNAFMTKDSPVAIISALCGITYTILAGKGVPICYPIGAIGSAFYVYLSFISHLWGNLLLYALYYIPMQILGFFQWNKNLQDNKYEIKKTKLNTGKRVKLLFITLAVTIFTIFTLIYFNDKNPIFDGITTIFSVLGMYLTVKRCVEQWIVWFLVNILSFIMWIDVALSGARVYSTVIMWGVYSILAVYFFFRWEKEVK